MAILDRSTDKSLLQIAADVSKESTGTAGQDGNVVINPDGSNIAGGGGSGGAVTIADGANVAQGTTTDAAYASGAGTVVAILKGIFARLRGGQATMANSLPVTMASDQSALSTTATGNVASGATDSGNPVKAGGVYNSTEPTLTTGQRGDIQLDANGNQIVAGSVASGATDAGNPIKVGGRYNSAPPSLSTGQRADLQQTSNGHLKIRLFSSGDNDISTQVDTSSDGVGASAFRLAVANLGYTFNGTSWERERSNIDTASLITASAATTSQTGADQTNQTGRGIKVVLDMTSAGTGSVTLTIQGKDAASGKYYPLLAGAAVTTNSTNVYTVYPGAPAAANVSANDSLPRVWRVITTANNANGTTYTVGASILR